MTTVAGAADRERLFTELPDVPKWLQTRWMLSLETTEVTGLGELAGQPGGGTADPIAFLLSMILAPGLMQAEEEGGFIVRDPPTGRTSIVGTPPQSVILEAVAANDREEREGDIISQVENADYVEQAFGAGWERTPGKLHLLADSSALLGSSGPKTDVFGFPEMKDPSEELETETERAEFLSNAEVEQIPGVSDGLRRKLTIAALRGPVVGVKVEGVHVSFCHAEIQTESLWDVAIDTLEDHRRRGHAEKAVTHMARHMLDERNKRPVWGALETNEASLRLAAKLGFRPVDEVAVFERR